MKKEKICLVGCGWLGKALALDLKQRGLDILATTAHDKSGEFASDAIPYIQMDISEALPEQALACDIFIYMIPPLDLSVVKKFFDQLPVQKKIIFTSSTSVYGKHLGAVDETTEVSGTLLADTEDYLKSRFQQLTILRPGGLYGEKRHPIFFLQGKKDLTTGHEYLHLASQKDCVAAIRAVLESDLWNETINIISDLRSLKKDYYVMIANKLGLLPPQYLETKSVNETMISNEKSKRLLKMVYEDPSRF